MENIREEETEPLSSPPRRIAEAYSHNESRSKMKRCAYYIFFFTSMVCFALSHLSHGGDLDQKQRMRAQKVRKKAEIMPEDAVQKIQTAIKYVELDEKIAIINDAHAAYDESNDSDSSDSVDSVALVNDIMKDGDDLDREVKNVLADVDKAEQGGIDTNNSLIASAVKNLEDSIMYYLGNVFGGGGEYEEFDDDDDMVASTPSSDVTLTEKELDVIAKKILDRLELDAKKDFKAKADAVKDEKKVEIEQILEDDTQAKMALRDITKDVKEALPVVVEDLRDEIDEAAKKVKDSLPEKAKQIRDSVVEEVTGQSFNTIEKSKRAKAEKRKQLRKNFEEIVNVKTNKEASGMNEEEDIDTGFPNPNLVTSSSNPGEDIDASDTNREEEKSDKAKSDDSDDSSDNKKSVDVDGGKEMSPSEKLAKKKKDKINMETVKEKEETDEEEEKVENSKEEEKVETDDEEDDKSKEEEEEEEDRGNLALVTTTPAKVVQEQTDMHPGIKGKSAVKTNSAHSDNEEEDEDKNEAKEINQHGEEEDDDDNEEAVE